MNEPPADVSHLLLLLKWRQESAVLACRIGGRVYWGKIGFRSELERARGFILFYIIIFGRGDG